MNFRNDKQRRAMFANMFSSKRKLYHGTSDVFKTFIERDGLLPETEVPNPPSWDSSLKRDTSSISLTDEPSTAIVYGTLKSDAVGVPNKDIVVYEVDVPEEVLDPEAHMVSHYRFPVKTAEESLDTWHVASTKEFPLPPKREYELPADVRKDPDVSEFKTFFFDHADPGLEEIGYLDEKKKLTKKIDKKYNFSFKNRRAGSWYPGDFNPPDEFPDIIRTTVHDIMQSGQFKDATGEIYYDRLDEKHTTIMNGMVNQKLQEIWKPEWGVKPSGRYIKPDVEDAMEDLM